MTTYQDIRGSFEFNASPPPKVITLPICAWASSYEGKPECEVSIGIRLPGQDDAEIAEAEAIDAMRSARDEDEAVRAYSEAKLLCVVARCICSTSDVTAPHELFETPDAILRIALTKQGIRRIFDEIERLQIENSPIFREASDSDVEDLIEMIQGGALARCKDSVSVSRIRRYLAFCVESLTANVQQA